MAIARSGGVEKLMIKCIGCGGRFEHYTRNKAIKKEYCDPCLTKRRLRVTKKWQSRTR